MTDRAKRRVILRVVCAAAFGGLAFAVLGDSPLLQFDRDISASVQQMRTDALDRVFILITMAGNGLALMLLGIAILGALIWQRLWRTALGVGAVMGLTPLIVTMFKATIQRPRPLADLYTGVESFSFPSGHMTNSAVIIGVLLLLAGIALVGRRRVLVQTALIIVIGLIGVSRIYLGAHWPTDIVAGGLLATAMLTLADGMLSREPNRAALANVFYAAAIAAIVITFGHAFFAYETTAARYLIPGVAL